jgi:hypothetical protein
MTQRTIEKIVEDDPATNLLGSVAYSAAAQKIAMVGSSGDSPISPSVRTSLLTRCRGSFGSIGRG